jgi:hypothetical protein
VLLALKNKNRSITPPVLAQFYQEKLHCAGSTADAYARIAFQIFRYVGAVEYVDGAIKLKEH